MKSSLRRKVVEELLRQEGSFVSLSHLECALAADRKSVQRVMQHLVRIGAATVIRKYPRHPVGKRGRPSLEVVYRPRAGIERLLTSDRKRATGWDRIWRVVRSARTFTRQDLCELAGVSMNNARLFTKRLRDAGYIRQRTRGAWELVRDPGPLRPVVGRHASRKEG